MKSKCVICNGECVGRPPGAEAHSLHMQREKRKQLATFCSVVGLHGSDLQYKEGWNPFCPGCETTISYLTHLQSLRGDLHQEVLELQKKICQKLKQLDETQISILATVTDVKTKVYGPTQEPRLATVKVEGQQFMSLGFEGVGVKSSPKKQKEEENAGPSSRKRHPHHQTFKYPSLSTLRSLELAANAGVDIKPLTISLTPCSKTLLEEKESIKKISTPEKILSVSPRPGKDPKDVPSPAPFKRGPGRPPKINNKPKTKASAPELKFERWQLQSSNRLNPNSTEKRTPENATFSQVAGKMFNGATTTPLQGVVVPDLVKRSPGRPPKKPKSTVPQFKFERWTLKSSTKSSDNHSLNTNLAQTSCTKTESRATEPPVAVNWRSNSLAPVARVTPLMSTTNVEENTGIPDTNIISNITGGVSKRGRGRPKSLVRKIKIVSVPKRGRGRPKGSTKKRKRMKLGKSKGKPPQSCESEGLVGLKISNSLFGDKRKTLEFEQKGTNANTEQPLSEYFSKHATTNYSCDIMTRPAPYSRSFSTINNIDPIIVNCISTSNMEFESTDERSEWENQGIETAVAMTIDIGPQTEVTQSSSPTALFHHIPETNSGEILDFEPMVFETDYESPKAEDENEDDPLLFENEISNQYSDVDTDDFAIQPQVESVLGLESENQPRIPVTTVLEIKDELFDE